MSTAEALDRMAEGSKILELLTETSITELDDETGAKQKIRGFLHRLTISLEKNGFNGKNENERDFINRWVIALADGIAEMVVPNLEMQRFTLQLMRFYAQFHGLPAPLVDVGQNVRFHLNEYPQICTV